MVVPAVEQECCIMTGERWQEIRTVLEAALPMDSEKRRAYLDQACASDPSLRREVESLLAADEQAQSGFLRSRSRSIPRNCNANVHPGLAAGSDPTKSPQ
jgi:hypothetical protein